MTKFPKNSCPQKFEYLSKTIISIFWLDGAAYDSSGGHGEEKTSLIHLLDGAGGAIFTIEFDNTTENKNLKYAFGD